MRPAENMEKLIKKLRFDADIETHDRILGNVLQALDTTEKQKSGAITTPNIRRTIMKSPIVKLAAAAVIVIAVFVGLPFFSGNGSGIVLADVLERIEQVPVFMYKMQMTMTGAMMPDTPAREMETEATITISNEYGMKMEMAMVDANSGEKRIQQWYIIPEDRVMIMVMPEQKKFTRMEFDDDIFARMKKQNNDPREMLKQIMSCDYTELGRSVIDGIEVEGFETTDPRFMAGMAEEVKVTLWVDTASWLPVRQELNIQVNEQMQMQAVVYDYQWDVQVDASEFEPVIPEDFTCFPTGGMKMPSMTEEAAIEGLRMFAELGGQYPKNLNFFTLMQEFGKLKNGQSPAAEQLRQKLEQAQSEEEKATEVMDMMRPVTSLGAFYMTLVQDKKEPIYYGESVGPDDAGSVLLRWKISDNQYRVIFGDLTAENFTAEELTELEKSLLQ